MSKYTTGEMAKLCKVSVRTVQFYDKKGLLIPSELSEGGRRIYSDDDLKRLQLILLLKSLGLSLNSVKDILESNNPKEILSTLLSEQSRQIEIEMNEKKKQLNAIEVVKDNLELSDAIYVKSVSDIDKMMENKRKYKRIFPIMIVVGILIDIAEVSTLLLWIFKGLWLPFVIFLPLMIATTFLLVRWYYKNSAYICPNCKKKFKPKFWEFFFSNHTRKTRKLTCTDCGKKDWCTETYPD